MNLTPEDQIRIEFEFSSRLDLKKNTYGVIILKRNSPHILGRSKEQADSLLKDQSASRKHLELRLIRNNVWIKDLDTKNGTFLNGRRVDSKCLKIGDIITIGDHLIYVRNLYFSVGIDLEVTAPYIIASDTGIHSNNTITSIVKRLTG